MRSARTALVGRWAILTGLAVQVAVPASRGHAGGVPPDAAWWTVWNVDPLIMASLFWLSAAYALGFRAVRAQRGEAAPAGVRHAAAFAAGIAALIAALLSPIDRFAAELLSVHMVQHMLLMNVAAPLVVLGAPLRTVLWLLPPGARGKLGRFQHALARHGYPRYLLWQPLLLVVVYAAVLWIWHWPSFYEAALRVAWIHDVQHLMFFAVSCLFWRVLFDPIGQRRLSHGMAVLYLFATSLHATLLGVYMALAPRVWYSTYASRADAFGLTALEDQQLAGYIMWMPACMAYALVAAVVFARWLGEDARKALPASRARAGP